VIAPLSLMLWATVPWLTPVPAPGTSKVVIVPSGGPQEAVNYKTGANVQSRDCSTSVDALGDSIPGARGIESGEGAIGGAQETVRYRTRVAVVPRDCSVLVNAVSVGALAKARAGARGVERGEGTVGDAQEA